MDCSQEGEYKVFFPLYYQTIYSSIALKVHQMHSFADYVQALSGLAANPW
jgi:hypothetical protein